VAGSGGHDNEASASVNSGEFLDKLNSETLLWVVSYCARTHNGKLNVPDCSLFLATVQTGMQVVPFG
jgi:hypothetical protein